jgi:hypothetical protein
MVIVMVIVVVVVFAITIIVSLVIMVMVTLMVMSMAIVMRRVLFGTHEIHRSIASIVLATVPAPVPRMVRRHV